MRTLPSVFRAIFVVLRGAWRRMKASFGYLLTTLGALAILGGFGVIGYAHLSVEPRWKQAVEYFDRTLAEAQRTAELLNNDYEALTKVHMTTRQMVATIDESTDTLNDVNQTGRASVETLASVEQDLRMLDGEFALILPGELLDTTPDRIQTLRRHLEETVDSAERLSRRTNQLGSQLNVLANTLGRFQSDLHRNDGGFDNLPQRIAQGRQLLHDLNPVQSAVRGLDFQGILLMIAGTLLIGVGSNYQRLRRIERRSGPE